MFLRAVVLGGLLGLAYDLLRALRKLGGRIWGGALDTLAVLLSACALFFFTMAGSGELRLFILLGALGGFVLFFCLLSEPLRPLWDFWLDLLLLPGTMLVKAAKKICLILKKPFSFCRGWVTMKLTKLIQPLKQRRRGKGAEPMAAQKKAPSKRKERKKTQKKLGGKLMGLVLLLLFIAASVQLVELLGDLQEARAEEASYAQQLAALKRENAQLEADIARSGDPDTVANIARDELGLVAPGEKVFRFSD